MRRTRRARNPQGREEPSASRGLAGLAAGAKIAADQAGAGGRIRPDRIQRQKGLAAGRAPSLSMARKRAFALAMHAQPESSPSKGLDREADALRLLSEQVAMPLDQLARFLALDLGQGARLAQHLDERGLVESKRFLARDYPWLWLSRRGAERAGTGFPYREPDVSSIAHRRALNEIRLHLRDRAPEGRWVCERVVYRRRDPEDHLPDAVFEIGGERHAIEAELSTKTNSEIRQIVAEHSNRYDAVLYFCGPHPYNLLKRVQAEGRWPKLVVRRLPQGELC